MNIIFRLSQYNNYEVVIPKDKLLASFPTGLIATTLELDPSATDINIPTAIITPDILDFFQRMVVENKIPDNIPEDIDNIFRAGDYLQLDILQVVADPLYSEFHQLYSDINLLDTQSLNTPEIYNRVLEYALTNHYSSLLDYLFSNTNKGEHKEADTRGVSIAILSDYMYGVEELLKLRGTGWRGSLVDLSVYRPDLPNVTQLSNMVNKHPEIASLIYVIINGNWNIMQLLSPYMGRKPRPDLLSIWPIIAGLSQQYPIADNLIDVYGINNIQQGRDAVEYLWNGPPELIQKIYNSPYVTSDMVELALRRMINNIQNYDINILLQYFNIIVTNLKVPQWFPWYVRMMNDVKNDELISLTKDHVSNMFVLPLIYTAIYYNNLKVFPYLLDIFSDLNRRSNTVPFRRNVVQIFLEAIKYNRPEIVIMILNKRFGKLERQWNTPGLVSDAYNLAQQLNLPEIVNIIQQYLPSR